MVECLQCGLRLKEWQAKHGLMQGCTIQDVRLLKFENRKFCTFDGECPFKLVTHRNRYTKTVYAYVYCRWPERCNQQSEAPIIHDD